MKKLLIASLIALTAAAPPTKLLTPTDIVNAAPPSAWKTIPADNVLVMDLASGGRVVIQLAPAFAPVHVANIKALARGRYRDGATVYRVQDNYVAQWGLNDAGKPWPAGVTAKPPAEYTRPLKGLAITPLADLSRGVVGVRSGTLVVNLPGSVTAVDEGLDVLLPLVPHLLSQLDGGDH